MHQQLKGGQPVQRDVQYQYRLPFWAWILLHLTFRTLEITQTRLLPPAGNPQLCKHLQYQ